MIVTYKRRSINQKERERLTNEKEGRCLFSARYIEEEKSMKAWVLERYGKEKTMRLSELPEPAMSDTEVLVKVRAAGVNQLDTKIANGEFKAILPYRTPFILGHDLAGSVVRVGSEVRGFKPGDEVYARVDDYHIGTFAEFIAVKEESLAKRPMNRTMEESASIPLVGLTAWQALVEKAKLKKGQKVFIEAGSGGVGTFAIQLAKHQGAFVATTTSAANAPWVKNLGADLVIDYRKDDFETILRHYDVVLHSQDNKTLLRALKVLKPGGTLISISGPPDPAFGAEAGAPWLVRQLIGILSSGVRREAKRRGVNYSFLFMKANGGQLGKITALIDSGVIRPVVDRTFTFEETPAALDYVETGHAKGKIVIKI
jgi:alcohol dehydrogenase